MSRATRWQSWSWPTSWGLPTRHRKRHRNVISLHADAARVRSWPRQTGKTTAQRRGKS